MEWFGLVKQHWVYELAQAAGLGAIGRWAFLEFVKEKRHVALHQKNSKKIDWLITQVGAMSLAQSVALEPGLDKEDLQKLKDILQPCQNEPKNTSDNSSQPCNH